LGNYESEKIGMAAEVGDSTAQQAFETIKKIVMSELYPAPHPVENVTPIKEVKNEVAQPEVKEQPKEEKKPTTKKAAVAKAAKEVPASPKVDKKITLFDVANAEHKKLFLDHVKTLYPKMIKDCPEHVAAKASLQEVKEIPFIDENGDVLPEFYKYVTTLMETRLAGSANVTEEATV
jgi:hypothetical protein